MFSVVRYSQIIGLIAVDSSTASRLGEVEEVWLDELGRIAYLSSAEGYLSLEQVSGVGTTAISIYGRIYDRAAPMNLRRLHRLVMRSTLDEPLGWIEDFLFDWHTGEIVAYILAGDIAESFGGRAVLYPEDVLEIVSERIVIREGAKDRLKSEAEGLKGFLSEKSDRVRHLVKIISDRLHDLISPHDKPEVVRVKIETVSDELANSDEHDRHALQEATDFLQEQWQHLQQSISRASSRAKSALDSAWKQIAGKR
ncbi:MAG: PRC-barrel domain-containing protein [Hydrococcus sp. C42_A2020_068]|nr:PRC-barrel domain-containing protein [Hydrococcus sp. C42_A2020_068]